MSAKPKPKPPLPRQLIEQAAPIMKAVSHPIRLRILEILEREGEANVTALCRCCKESQPVVSGHLQRMRSAGVVATRREGASIHYRVARPEVLGMLECIRKMGGKRR